MFTNQALSAERRAAQQQSALLTLARIAAQPDADGEEALRQALVLGCAYLELPLGIISRIRGNDYEVFVQHTPDAALQDGQHFELGQTYCAGTILQDDVVVIAHAGASDTWSGHPCYAQFGLESYLGMTLIVHGERWGTLNFSSAEPRVADRFGREECEFVRVLAQWVSGTLARMALHERLRRQGELNAAIARIQTAFIGQHEQAVSFGRLLAEICQLTHSDDGWIGDVAAKAGDAPHLHEWASISSTAQQDAVEILPPLLFQAWRSGAVAERHTDASTQEGTPGPRNAAALPVYYGKQCVALIGLAGRSAGYDASLYAALAPMLSVVGQLVHSEAETAALQRTGRHLTTALQDSMDRLDLVIDGTGVGIWDWNIDTGDVLFNARWAEIVGYTLEELGKTSIQTWKHLAHPDDLADSQEKLAAHWRGESPRYGAEARMRHKDGHWVWVLDTGRVVAWNPDGSPHRMVGTHLDITEQKEVALNHERQRAMLNAMSRLGRIGAWALEVEHGQLFWSDMTRAIHEVAPDYVPSLETALDFYLPGEHRALITTLVSEAIGNGEPFNVELPIQTAQGNVVWVAALGDVEWQDGKVVRLVGSFQDIDARKRSELALAQAHRHHQTLATLMVSQGIQSGSLERAARLLARAVVDALDVARGGIWLWDTDSAELSAVSCYDRRGGEYASGCRISRQQSPRFVAAVMSGAPLVVESVRADPATMDLNPDYLAEQGTASLLALALHDGRRVVGMVCAEHVAGPRSWTGAEQSFMTSLATLAGTVLATQQRQLLEAQAREQAEQTSAVLENLIDGVITIDRHGIMTQLNPAAESVFGYARADLLGQNVSMLMGEPERSAHDSYLASYLAGGGAHIIGYGREVNGRRSDGSMFPLELSVSACSHRNEPIFIGVVRDISERKRIERMKGEFVSTVSHELRTPLTAINGALGLLCGGAAGALPETAKQMLHLAKMNGERLALLINDLLDMEKLAAGKMQFQLEALDLAAEVETACAANRHYAEQYDVRYAARVTHAYASLDGKRLQQVLANLMSNAAKFAPAGSTVDVVVSENEGWVEIAVSDHGLGVPETFRTQLFQKFLQADASDSRQKGGTGLGLAISRELVERMGGDIRYETTPGGGATFVIAFPACRAEDGTSGSEKANHGCS
ncbi:PAS domain S-box protein [Chitinibacteraceae bacterium HSL-7]